MAALDPRVAELVQKWVYRGLERYGWFQDEGVAAKILEHEVLNLMGIVRHKSLEHSIDAKEEWAQVIACCVTAFAQFYGMEWFDLVYRWKETHRE